MHKLNVKNTVFSAHIMEACRGSRGIYPLVLNLGIRWRKTFRERNPGTKWIGGWMGHRRDLDI
jgi:hypothetical protein